MENQNENQVEKATADGLKPKKERRGTNIIL